MRHLKKRILVVCHDAGAAEIISAYIKKHTANGRFYCLVSGPAKKIFNKKGLSRFMVSEARGLALLNLRAIAAVLCGTSWDSSVERDYLGKARALGVKSVVYLDHWTNYRQRFGYPKKEWRHNLPDEFWAGDEHALSLAKRCFKDRAVRLVPNAYWREIKSEYRAAQSAIRPAGRDILFISEPALLSQKTLYQSGYSVSETDMLKKVLDYLSENKATNNIIIRYHPSEKKDKYRALLARYQKSLRFSRQHQRVTEDFACAEIVIGRRSMALALAALCGKKTVSFVPDRKVPFLLPFKEIVRIRDIKQLGKVL